MLIIVLWLLIVFCQINNKSPAPPKTPKVTIDAGTPCRRNHSRAMYVDKACINLEIVRKVSRCMGIL